MPGGLSYISAAVTADVVGNNTLVAAVANRKIRVVAAFLTGTALGTAQFQDGVGGAGLTGGMQLSGSFDITLPFNRAGWFETSSGTLLNLATTGTGQKIRGVIQYVLD